MANMSHIFIMNNDFKADYRFLIALPLPTCICYVDFKDLGMMLKAVFIFARTENSAIWLVYANMSDCDIATCEPS